MLLIQPTFIVMPNIIIHSEWVNVLMPNDAKLRHREKLVQVLTCRPFGATPLPKLILTNNQMNSKEHFHSRNEFGNVCGLATPLWIFINVRSGNGLLLIHSKPFTWANVTSLSFVFYSIRNTFQWNLIQHTNISIQQNALETNIICKSFPLCHDVHVLTHWSSMINRNQLNICKNISVKFKSKYNYIYTRNRVWKSRLQNFVHQLSLSTWWLIWILLTDI